MDWTGWEQKQINSGKAWLWGTLVALRQVESDTGESYGGLSEESAAGLIGMWILACDGDSGLANTLLWMTETELQESDDLYNERLRQILLYLDGCARERGMYKKAASGD